MLVSKGNRKVAFLQFQKKEYTTWEKVIKELKEVKFGLELSEIRGLTKW